MTFVAQGAHSGEPSLRPPSPAPTPGMLALMRRLPIRAGNLSPLAATIGLTAEEIESAVSVAIRRGAIRLMADNDGAAVLTRGGR